VSFVSIVSFTVVRYVFDGQLFLRSAHQKSIAFVNNLLISVTLIVVAVPEGVLSCIFNQAVVY